MGNWQLGKAMGYAKDKMGAVFEGCSHAWCYAWYSAHFFGDPAQTLRIGDYNNPVTFNGENPNDGESDVSIGTSSLSVTINDPDGDIFNWTIETSPDVGDSSGNNASNGSKTCSISGLSYSTAYTWYVNATDGDTWTRESYTFTTEAAPVNDPPVFSGASITNGSTGVALSTSSVSITINDPEGDTFNWTIQTSPNVGNSSDNNAGNGSKSCTISGLVAGTSYKWYVNATDGNSWTRSWYSFRTSYAPNISSPSPSDGSINVDTATSSISVLISDQDADTFNWTIQTSPNVGSSSGNNAVNGTKSCSISGLNYSTVYTWYVNVTDGDSWTNSTYNFTTRSKYVPNPPSSFVAAADGRFEIDLSWVKPSYAYKTLIEWKNTSSPWTRGSGTVLYNGTGQSVSHSDLSPSTTVYYQAWSWNETDRSWSTTNRSDDATTASNTLPSIGSPSPVNGSVDQETTLTWSVAISDSNGDVFNWTIECSNGQSSNANGASNGTKQLSINGLGYLTNYTVWVNVTDSYGWTRTWYTFTTREAVNYPPVFSSLSLTNGSVGVTLGLSSLSLVINDTEGDTIDWSIETSPDIGGNSGSGVNGTMSCDVSDLFAGITYKWYVNATDGNSWARSWYSFRTSYAPTVISPSPSNGSTGVSISTTSLSVTISDLDGETFNWTISTSPNIGNNSVNDAVNGMKSCTVSGLGYSTVYTWFVNVTDGDSWTNKSYSFTTEAYTPPSPPSGPSGPSSTNDPPVAEAGGPYTGFIGQSVSFDGSSSNDSDGVIVTYSWSFGDGTTGAGVQVSHSYSNAGVYTVTLTVTDNDGDSDSDTATVTVSVYQGSTNNSNQTNGYQTYNSSSNQTFYDVPGEVVDIIQSIVGNVSVIENISIGDTVCYLMDTDGDGSVDMLFNSVTNNVTMVYRIGSNTYLIDEDGDEQWDYVYDATYGSISPYVGEKQEEKTFILDLWIFVGSIGLAAVLVFVWYYKNRIQLFMLTHRFSKIRWRVLSSKPGIYHHSKPVHKTAHKRPPVGKNADVLVDELVKDVKLVESISKEEMDVLEEDIISQKVDDLLKRSLKTSGYSLKKMDDGYSRDLDVSFLVDHTKVSKFIDEVEFSDVARYAIVKRLKECDVDREIDDLIFSKRMRGFSGN